MTAITMPLFSIDTLQFSKRMQRAGLQQQVAEELAKSLKESCSYSTEGLATKEDIKFLDQKIENVEQKLEQKIESLEYKITTKMFLMLTVAVGVITWLDKIL